MQQAICPDRPGASSGGKEMAYLEHRPIVSLEIPRSGLGPDRPAAIVEEHCPVASVEPAAAIDIDAEPGAWSDPSEKIMDSVTLVVADEGGIARAPPADVD